MIHRTQVHEWTPMPTHSPTETEHWLTQSPWRDTALYLLQLAIAEVVVKTRSVCACCFVNEVWTNSILWALSQLAQFFSLWKVKDTRHRIAVTTTQVSGDMSFLSWEKLHLAFCYRHTMPLWQTLALNHCPLHSPLFAHSLQYRLIFLKYN